MRKSVRLSTAANLFLIAIPFSLLLSIAVYALEQALDHLFPDIWNTASFILFVVAMLLILYLWLLVIAPRINRLSAASAKEVSRADYPRIEYLITGYSPLMIRDAQGQPVDAAVAVDTFIAEHPDLATACRGIDRPTYRLPWQQNLRVINDANHSETLKKILFLEPAQSQSDLFLRFLANYVPDIAAGRITSQNDPETAYASAVRGNPSRDYEDFGYVTAGIDRAMAMLAKDEHCEVRDIEHLIAIDITPGFKIFSIAAAIQSLNRNMVFFYAKTGTDSGKVIAYDASVGVTGTPI